MLRTVIRYVKIYAQFVKLQAMYHFMYRQGLLMGLLVDLGHVLITIVFFNILYRNVTEVAGWDYHEMLVFLGMHIFSSFAVLNTVSILNLRTLPEKIKNGAVDLVLVKPLSSMFVLSFEKPYLVGFLSALPGVYLIYYGFSHSGHSLSILGVFIATLVFICGYVIAASIQIMMASVSFRWINATTLPKISEKMFTNFKANPRLVYQGMTRVVFTFVFPAVFMASVPAEFLLGEIGIEWLGLAFLMASIFMILTVKVWNFMIRGYTSAGG